MFKRTIRKKGQAAFFTSNVISVILCIITMGLLIATCLNTHCVNKRQAKSIQEINELALQISNGSELSTEKTLESIYLSYYNGLDQKATDSINVALSFFGFIFSLVTIVNTIITITIPRKFEKNLYEIEDRIKEVERNARECTNAVHYIDSVSSKKTIREKIDAITNTIEEYGDNSGHFYFARGFLYDDIKDYDNAKADYILARKAGGAEHAYYNSMGVLYSNVMNEAKTITEKKCAFKKSEQYYKKAIRILENEDKKSDYCHCNLACLYQDYAKALKGWSVLEKINAVSFENGEYSKAFQKYSDLALDEFNQTIKMNDDYLTAFYNRGISYREMGENFYTNAYNDFMKCYEIDPDNKDVWEVLFSIALSLFQKTNDKKYYDIAKKCIKKLREDINNIELLSQQFDAIQTSAEVINKFKADLLLANIDERIADLYLEEAEEHADNLAEYGNRISDALDHYDSALEIYKQLYSTSKNDELREAIERLQNKVNQIKNLR